MRDMKRRVEALEVASQRKAVASDLRPVRINFVVCNPGQPNHGAVAFAWERAPGEASYRRVGSGQIAP